MPKKIEFKSPCESCEFIDNCGWGWGDYDAIEEPPCDTYIRWWHHAWTAAKHYVRAGVKTNENRRG